MWLWDALRGKLSGAREMLYGYEFELAESANFQSLGDVAS